MCPRCAECGTAPHEIDEDCVNCWSCLKDEGFVRSGVPDKQTQEQPNKPEEEKPIEVTR